MARVREIEEKGVTTAIVIEFADGLTGYHRNAMREAIEKLFATTSDPDAIDMMIEDYRENEGI